MKNKEPNEPNKADADKNKMPTSQPSKSTSPDKSNEPEKTGDMPNQIYEETLPPEHRLN